MNALHLIERNLFMAPVIDLGGPGRAVPGHRLSDLQAAAVAQIRGDAGAAKRMAADLRHPRLLAPALDHAEYIHPMQGPCGQRPCGTATIWRTRSSDPV